MRVIRIRIDHVFVVIALALLGCATVPKAADYLDPARLRQLVTARDLPYLLLDVRTQAEFQGGHIPTAQNIPYDTISERMPSVPKNSLIIVYCASGARATVAARRLAEMGYTNVGNFGAISRWEGELSLES